MSTSQSTATFGLPYPAGSDTPVVHDDLRGLAVKTDAELGNVKAVGVAAQTTATAAQTAAAAAQTSVTDLDTRMQPRLLVEVDAPDGGPWSVGIDWRGRHITPETASGSGMTVIDAPSAGMWNVGNDWRGSVVGGSTTTGGVDLAGRTQTVAAAPNYVRTPAGVRRLTSDGTRIAAWGDSLTRGHPRPPFATDGSDSWPAVLDAAWTGGTVYNGGVHGQTSEQIAMRSGALTLTAVSAFTIPADTATSVTFTSREGIRNALTNTYDGGSIAGIPVTLEQTGATLWKVTRLTAGAATVVPAGTMYDPGTDAQADAVTVLFIGRNEMLGITADQVTARVGRVLASTAAMIARLTPVYPAFLVLGPITATNEGRGTIQHTAITTINAELARLYPGNYLDIRAYLRDKALADAGITPSAGDIASMASDTWGPSLAISGDYVHYTPQTAALIATQVKTALTSKGYLA